MGQAWRKDQASDRFFRQAKAEGYRARSAYKLIEMAEKYRLFRPGMRVLDLGAAPGSWSQVVSQIVGPSGQVVAVDLQPIEPIRNVRTIVADLRDERTISDIEAALGGPADVVISDLGPPATGIAMVDHARSVELATIALSVARRVLKTRGTFVTKILRGSDFDAYLNQTRRSFKKVQVAIPEATRPESREVYVIGKSFQPLPSHQAKQVRASSVSDPTDHRKTSGNR